MEKDEYEQSLSELEVRVERLRSLYEQYFIGIERIEPAVARKDVDRRFWNLRKVRMRNTALRFRFQTLTQRYSTLQQYWVRICRQIENGTYSRHVRRANKILNEPALDELNPATEAPRSTRDVGRGDDGSYDLGRALSDELESDAALAQALTDALGSIDAAAGDAGKGDAAKPVRLQAPAPQPEPDVVQTGPARRLPPPLPKRDKPPVPVSKLDENRIAALHSELAAAREKLRQGSVSVQSVEQRLRATEEQLRARYPGKKVDFKVEVRDGKAVIKPFLR